MEQAPRAPGRLDWLDYARLVCALWVMLDHYFVVALDSRVGNGIRSYGWATEVARFGTISLFVFLMMSGMVITMVAGRQSAATFVTHRVARVYPTFVVGMTLTALVSFWGPERFHVSVPQYLANLTIYPQMFGYRPVDGVYWTLIIEIIFYAGMLAVIVVGAIRHLQAIVAAWVLLQVAALAQPWQLPLLGLDYYFLAAGAVLGLLYQRRNERLNLALLAISLPLCLFCAYHYARQFRFDPLIGSIITIGIFGLFLIMRGRNPTLPFAKRIGSMTYALYLLHFHIGLTIFSRWIDESNKWLMVAGVSLFMIAASFAIDHVLEFRLRPFWLKLAARTVARPFARWGQRNVPAHGDGIDMPQLKPFP